MLRNSTSLGTVLLAVPAILLLGLAPLHAATLSGSGPHLPFPSPNPGDPGGVSPTQVASSGGGGFTGTWTAPAHPDWIGTFNATGPIPAALSTGVTTYDFSTLPTGQLPAGTYFIVGDVDGGSTLSEMIDFTAYDSGGNELALWLDEPIGVWGTGISGTPMMTDLPGYDYDGVVSDSYRIDGATVTGGNPSVSAAMVSNQPISRLVVNKHSTHFGFGLRAPDAIPEPATGAMLAVALGACAFSMRRRRER